MTYKSQLAALLPSRLGMIGVRLLSRRSFPLSRQCEVDYKVRGDTIENESAMSK
jgi:hypothetical protein